MGRDAEAGGRVDANRARVCLAITPGLQPKNKHTGGIGNPRTSRPLEAPGSLGPNGKRSKAMKRHPDVSPVPFPRWRFGAALLGALHETRRRQAARELHNYRYLIDRAKTDEMWARLFASQ